jgi:hypothetical protein
MDVVEEGEMTILDMLENAQYNLKMARFHKDLHRSFIAIAEEQLANALKLIQEYDLDLNAEVEEKHLEAVQDVLLRREK